MAITSADFRQQNKVLFTAGIYEMKGIPAEVSGESVELFKDTVIIDMNQDGKPEFIADESFNRVIMKVTEPCFVTSYPSIQELAAKEKTDILTQNDVRSPKVESFGYDLGKWAWSSDHKLIQENRRTLDTLVDEAGAFPKEAKWAIDVKKGEFLVYTPGS